jgi:hypothetical protein
LVLVFILVYRRNVVHSYKKQIKERFPQLSDSDEAAERMAVLNHISKDDIVLEIGANIGGVSTLLASILSNSKNLVSVDPHKGNCRFLKKEGKRLDKPFHVFHGVVKGPTLLSCTGSNKVGSYVHCEPCQSNPLTENLSISEIEQRYGLQFTTVVIDCEGCYESLMPQILKHKTIRQIQIEWDGKCIEDDILKAGYKHVDTYTHLYLYKGVRVYKKPLKKAVKKIEKF